MMIVEAVKSFLMPQRVIQMLCAAARFTSLYVGAVEENAATGVWEIGGVCGMITAIFPTVFLGGLFGKVLADSGAAQSIASTLVNKFVMPVNNKEKQAKRAVLIMLLIECILTYGGGGTAYR